MMKQNSLRPRVLIVMAALTLAAVAAPQSAAARDKEFGVLVHYVESHYQVHRQYRFLLGFASLAVNIVHPEGVKGMKLALWENEKIKTNGDADDFPDVVKAGLAEGWQPMVRVWSRRNGERTVIFAKPDGKDMKVLVATVDQEDAVVVQVKIDPDKLSRCIDEWSHKDRHGNRDHDYDHEPDLPGNESAEASPTAEGT